MIRAIIESKVELVAGTLVLFLLGSIAGREGRAAQDGKDGKDAREVQDARRAKDARAASGWPADVEGLQQAERTWARALETADLALLEGLVDDEMSFIGPDGQLEDRGAYLAGYRALPAMGVKVEKIDVDQMKVRVLGDTGVVTGHVLARVRVGPDTIVEDVRFTRVYQRRGTRWRMVAGQGTRIAPPAPPAHK